ncbi:MAG: FtsW/RodA/SpoVE family cell cycle protein [Eubacteriales bacterium]|jgi:rod shape determining protein RodA
MSRFRDICGEFFATLRRMDFLLFAATSALSLLSILTLVGGYSVFGLKVILMQTGATVVGIVMMFFISVLDYRTIAEKLGIYLYGAGLLLLAATLLFGTSEGENKSWLYLPGLPFGIQPSEFVKSIFLLTFSYHIFRVKKKINKPLTLLGLMVHAALPTGLILLSGDLGVTLVYVGIILLMLFYAGLSLWYFAGTAVLAAGASPLLWQLLREDQKLRILVGFNPDLDPLGKGYQPIISRAAVANGGFFGRGIFGGSMFQKLPAGHTDFLFGTYAEKFGFLGALLFIGIMVFVVIRVARLAKLTRGDSGTYICVGFAAMLIIQTVENVGMCLGMLPVVGITLPYFSYGGSSVLAIYIMTGIVQSTAIHRNRLRSPLR